MDQFTREIIVEDRIRELQREAAQRRVTNGANRSLSARLASFAKALLRRGGVRQPVVTAPCETNGPAGAKHASTEVRIDRQRSDFS